MFEFVIFICLATSATNPVNTDCVSEIEHRYQPALVFNTLDECARYRPTMHQIVQIGLGAVEYLHENGHPEATPDRVVMAYECHGVDAIPL